MPLSNKFRKAPSDFFGLCVLYDLSTFLFCRLRVVLSSIVYFYTKPCILNGAISLHIRKKKKSEKWKERFLFRLYLSWELSKEKSSMEKSSTDFFSPLIQQPKKFSVCISQRKLVSSRNLTEKNIVFYLGFYLKSHFHTKSNANLVICLLPCHHGLICNNKYVSGTTQRGFTD